MKQHVCMYLCVYVCIYVRMYVCVYVYVYRMLLCIGYAMRDTNSASDICQCLAVLTTLLFCSQTLSMNAKVREDGTSEAEVGQDATYDPTLLGKSDQVRGWCLQGKLCVQNAK